MESALPNDWRRSASPDLDVKEQDNIHLKETRERDDHSGDEVRTSDANTVAGICGNDSALSNEECLVVGPSIYNGEFSHLQSPISAGYLGRLNSDGELKTKLNGFNRPISAETPYGVWDWLNRLEASLTVIVWITFGLGLLAICVASYLKSAPPTMVPPAGDALWNLISARLNSGFRNAGSMSEVLQFLPLASVFCVATTMVVGYFSKRSKSRKIDWTDSHLLLEYSGPVSLALKWQSIKRVDEMKQWELFHGKQPVYIVNTHKGKVFRLRLSDITQKHNIGEFFSLIKTNAPHATLNVSNDTSKDKSYTELWLKYFSTPAERQKTGLLQNKMVLDGGRYQILGTVGGGGQGTAYLAAVQTAAGAYSSAPITHAMPIKETALEDVPPIEKAVGARSETLIQSSMHVPEPSAASLGSPDATAASSSPATSSDSLAAAVTEHIMEPRLDELAQTPHVVLKEYVLPVHRGQLTAERTADKLKGEATILQTLDHPQIVKLLDAFIEDYRGYLVLEFVDGDSLKAMVDRLGPQPPEQVIALTLQVCEILQYLHNQTPPVVHRDITPDNLMLQENGEIKLVDFNVACQVDLSATATVVGKHAYIPAEQFRGKPTTQSDIYALGGTMFYLLTGQEPEPITPSHPRALNDLVSPELDDIVAKATASSLGNRFASVEDLALALQTLPERS